MGKSVLLMSGIFTTVFGLCCVIAPHIFYQLYMGGDFPTASAAIDGRADYGGFSLGMGLFLLYCTKVNVRLGLTASFIALLCIIPSRLIGYVLDGPPNQYMHIFLGIEIVLLVLTILALRKMKPSE